MNQKKAKRIRSDMRMAIAQDPTFRELPTAALPGMTKKAMRTAKQFYNNIARPKRRRFEIVD